MIKLTDFEIRWAIQGAINKCVMEFIEEDYKRLFKN